MSRVISIALSSSAGDFQLWVDNQKGTIGLYDGDKGTTVFTWSHAQPSDSVSNCGFSTWGDNSTYYNLRITLPNHVCDLQFKHASGTAHVIAIDGSRVKTW